MTTSEDLAQFVSQVRALESVDFPDVARGMNLNWFKDIKPNLKTSPKFLEELEEALEEMKYKLYQCLLQTGKDGKKRAGRDPEISYINAIIKHIDSGALLGMEPEGENAAPTALSEAQERLHLRRLGYSDEQIEEQLKHKG